MSRLEIKRVSAGYGRNDVVAAITLDIPESSVVALVGPNGHGKTTLLRAISGLVRVTSGSIVLQGSDITNLRPDRIAQMGMAHVPQGDLLFPLMNVRENLLMGAFGERSAQVVADRLEMVFGLFPKLVSLQAQTANSLSGGERRMVGLGRGLMAGAPVMLIDEPSLGLAPIVIDQVYGAIQAMKSRDISVLLVEENPERAASIADHIYLLDNGSIAWSGRPRELLGSKTILKTYLGM
ncbi:MAG: ABC transporter ATP-binding protein [Parvibaculaceae bacterium]